MVSHLVRYAEYSLLESEILLLFIEYFLTLIYFIILHFLLSGNEFISNFSLIYNLCMSHCSYVAVKISLSYFFLF